MSKQKKLLLIVLVFTGILTIYYYYIYQPIKVEINRLNIEENQKQTQYNLDLMLVSQLPGMRDKYNQLKDIEEIKLDFSSLTPEDFLILIEKISRETGARLTAYIPEKKAEYIVLNITLEGSYSNLNGFLTGLKRLANQLDVINLIIKPYEGDLEMKMVLHYKKKLGGDST